MIWLITFLLVALKMSGILFAHWWMIFLPLLVTFGFLFAGFLIGISLYHHLKEEEKDL